MSIGPTALTQTAEAMRKIRNSSRFILGSLGDRPYEHKVERAELGLADRYVLHSLHSLDKTARESYETYNFPRGMSGRSLLHGSGVYCNETMLMMLQ